MNLNNCCWLASANFETGHAVSLSMQGRVENKTTFECEFEEYFGTNKICYLLNKVLKINFEEVNAAQTILEFRINPLYPSLQETVLNESCNPEKIAICQSCDLKIFIELEPTRSHVDRARVKIESSYLFMN